MSTTRSRRRTRGRGSENRRRPRGPSLNTLLMVGFVLITAVVGLFDVSGGGVPLPAGRLDPFPASSSRPEPVAQATSPPQAAPTRSAVQRATQPPRAALVPARARPVAAPVRTWDGDPPYPARFFPPRAEQQPVLPPMVPPVVAPPVSIEPPAVRRVLPVEPVVAIGHRVRPVLTQPIAVGAVARVAGVGAARGVTAGSGQPAAGRPVLAIAGLTDVSVGVLAHPLSVERTARTAATTSTTAATTTTAAKAQAGGAATAKPATQQQVAATAKAAGTTKAAPPAASCHRAEQATGGHGDGHHSSDDRD